VITYLPHEKIKSYDLSITVGENEWAVQSIEERQTSDNESYALGFFYLTFAIIFLMFFLFSLQHNENLYFSLFCLFGSLSFLSGTTDFDLGIENIMVYAMIICIEFMTLFLAKVLVNYNRSKFPLFIIIAIAAASNHPYFMYSLGTFQINNASAFTGITFAVLILYTSISALYYLLQGFGQKKWEAKTITIGCFVGFLINIMFPVVLALIYGNALQSVFDNYVILTYVPDIGLCIYPLTVAFVLAKRNGRNQKQLIEQVNSIKKLSDLNLEKEKEKKKILEEQNTLLENKVAERTHELALKNELISYKNREITDSLIYAKRIQSAILPDIKLIYKALENAFIYYEPKDIVSGDFYGFSQKNNKVIIAAADCTGHGVSGAFMSMIGSSLFNQIINEKNVTTPSLILDDLNEGVIRSLKQRDSESNDGMDIALCSFDLDAGIVEYSGANRPLWLIRDNNIITYQANKFPIGGLQILHDDKFTNHVIKLEANDSIYIFSDGFADQFGGEFGKKFMTKHFKKVLLSIQHLSMPEQNNYLKNLFQEWKGNNEQVDDVLVIGIRI
jgi:serine phosphatase RsbU (regulator of sigma subunit)